MKMHSDFHMAQGETETSYVNNSRLQRKALFETKQVLVKALREVCATILPENLVASDLGCSSGENTYTTLQLWETKASHSDLAHVDIGGVDACCDAIQLPDGLEGHEGNICITKTTPLSVVERYQEQFRKDFILFLQLRNEELVFGGQMVLTFLGRKDDNIYNGNLNYLTELLAQSLWSLVDKVHQIESEFRTV
ncbi:hypothetical protein EJB05_45479, partial [Eragrostis curvula]